MDSGSTRFGLGHGLRPDGRRVAIATLAGEVVMLDVMTGDVASTGVSHTGGALAVAWHPRSVAVVAARDASVSVLTVAHTANGGVA